MIETEKGEEEDRRQKRKLAISKISNKRAEEQSKGEKANLRGHTTA